MTINQGVKIGAQMKTGRTDFHEVYLQVRFPFDARRDIVWREVCRYLQNKYIPAGLKVLDLGAGYCNFINNIDAEEKYAVDLYNEMPKWAADEVTTYVHTCTDLHFFEDNSLDVVFASNLFEHLPRPDLTQTLKEIKRVLRPGGQVLALQPNFRYCYKTYFDDYTHILAFTHEALADLLTAHHFQVTQVEARFLPVNMKSTLRFDVPRLDLITRFYLSLPFRPFAGQMLVVAVNPA